MLWCLIGWAWHGPDLDLQEMRAGRARKPGAVVPYLGRGLEPSPEGIAENNLRLLISAFGEDPTWTAPRSWGDMAGWVSCLAYADDVLLLAEQEAGLIRICRAPRCALRVGSMTSTGEARFVDYLARMCNSLGVAAEHGGSWRPVVRRLFWKMSRESIRLRFQKLRAEVLPVLLQGFPPSICGRGSSVQRWPRCHG